MTEVMIFYFVMQLDCADIWKWLVANQASMANWFTSVGTIGAVIVALWQTKRSEKQKKPEIMMNMTHHGVYWWYFNKNKSGEKWNIFNISNYGKTPARKLSVELTVNKTLEEIRDWLEENKLTSDPKLVNRLNNLDEIKKLNEVNNLNKTIHIQDKTKYKVEIQDYLFVCLLMKK